jgi:Holliday junction resolvasome RuvABC endonuclease subunit
MPIHFFIDPGFRALAMVVYDTREGIQDCGAIFADAGEYAATKKVGGSSRADALFMEHAVDFLNAFAKKYPCTKVFLELPHGGQNFRAVKLLSQVSGVIIGWAKAHDKKLVYYTPEQNKRNATGDLHASKQLMSVAIRKRMPSPFWHKLSDKAAEHVYDAAALIFTARKEHDL